ncbi:MAG: uric acid transporter [Solirubrobacteraceae bacterium]|nr:uric acid transporter [Solirubrobacteraceae bacterium]
MSFYVAATPRGGKAVHPVDEVLPPGRLAVYGAQHVLAFYAGAVIVPILLAAAIGLRGEELVYLISADLFTCGVASIIQAIGFGNVGVRLPLLQGVTFTAVAPMISIGQSQGGGVPGLLHIYGAVIVAGVVTFLFAPYYSRLLRLFPPVVTGTVITVIGVALLPVAAQQAGGGNPAAKDFGSFQNLELAGVTLLFIILVQRLWRGRFLATIAVLSGLVFGTVVATVFGITDFGGVSDAKAIGVTTPFHFGAPTFGVAAIVSMLIVMFITAVETTGDVFATGEIVEKPIRRNDIARAIRADGLATTLGGVLNSFPYTAFAENVGLVRLTRVKSRFVVAAAGVIMIVLGLLPKIAAVVASIPPAVLGGAAIVMFGTVAVIGIQTLSRVDFHDDRNVIIVAVSLGFALIPVAFPNFYSHFGKDVQSVVASGITMGAFSAILLNLFLNILGGRRNVVDVVEPTRARPELLTIEQVGELPEEEFVERFGGLFQGPPWIAAQVAGMRPFDSLYEMRHAFHSVLFDAPAERRRELICIYPDIAAKVALGQGSRRDQASAGLNRLTPQEYERFDALNEAYREKFGFPFIICVRENTKETILQSFERRLENTPVQEEMAALVEIAKIANLRLSDLAEERIPDVEEPPRPQAVGEPPRAELVESGDDGGVAPAGV